MAIHGKVIGKSLKCHGLIDEKTGARRGKGRAREQSHGDAILDVLDGGRRQKHQPLVLRVVRSVKLLQRLQETRVRLDVRARLDVVGQHRVVALRAPEVVREVRVLVLVGHARHGVRHQFVEVVVGQHIEVARQQRGGRVGRRGADRRKRKPAKRPPLRRGGFESAEANNEWSSRGGRTRPMARARVERRQRRPARRRQARRLRERAEQRRAGLHGPGDVPGGQHPLVRRRAVGAEARVVS